MLLLMEKFFRRSILRIIINYFQFSLNQPGVNETTFYVCARKECKMEIDEAKLASLPGIKCPYCGYRILYKKRPSIIKRIKAI